MKIPSIKVFGREIFKPRTPRTRSPDENLPPLRSGRISQPPTIKYLSPYRSRQTALLKTLRSTYDAVDAIELLTEETGDLSQALYNFVRLANVGHEMKIFALDKTTRLPDIELEWRDFASRVNAMSNAGLDGLIDQFHYLAFVRGAMTCEVEVAQTLDDIVEVYPVNPQTITWQLEERNGRQVWIPYQVPTNFISRTTLTNGMVSLEEANFFWVPTDPKVDDPRGRLLLKPALASIDFQIQILNDVQAVLHNQGFPRYDVSIDMEKLMTAIPPDARSDTKKLREWLKDHIQWVKDQFESLNPDDSFIHLSDTTVDLGNGAANQGRGIDVRAVMEMVDVQIENSVKTPGTMMQRVNSNTETWATVQFRVFVSGLQNIQRGSKRLIESICKLWLRVHGYQAIPVFEHNTIDYTSELQRSQIKQAKAVFLQLAQNMGWISGNEAANELFGHDAVGEPRQTQPPQQGGGDNQNNGDQSSNN
ncbi:MAG: hypothetical protein A4E55_01839 [Pelotomaculum sp. PtaU1.Bin035]|nr:MAG: hypothetical protein A4E55_01839 [Pelotomaculum sp. PtaU1.Bin035]